MTLARRVKGIFNGYVHGIVSCLETPEDAMREAIQTADKHLLKAKIHLKQLRKAAENQQQSHQECLQNIETWHARAKLYKQKKDDEKAMQCLQKKQQHKSKAMQLESQYNESLLAVKKISKQIEVIEQRKEDLQGRYRVYLAKKSTSLAAQAANEGVNATDYFPSTEMFERFEQALIELEIHIDADESQESEFEIEIETEEKNRKLQEEFEAL